MSISHLINANTHRAKEGARVLEDIARFVFFDEALFLKIRQVRHSLKAYPPVEDVSSDPGGIILCEKNIREGLTEIIQANALRLQEALRVLEELAQEGEVKRQMKALRYQAYDLHFALFSALKKFYKLHFLQGLYPVIDADLRPVSLEQMIHRVNQTPVHLVQYRNKSGSKKHVHSEAALIRSLLDPSKLLIINDHIDIALEFGDGVHIGQSDYPLRHVRNIIPAHFIFGISCHTLDEARMAREYAASYIAVGCLFSTDSKKNTIPVSQQVLQDICRETDRPVCGIGGISPLNLDQVIVSGARMAAAISCLWRSNDPVQTMCDMHARIMAGETHVSVPDQ